MASAIAASHAAEPHAGKVGAAVGAPVGVAGAEDAGGGVAVGMALVTAAAGARLVTGAEPAGAIAPVEQAARRSDRPRARGLISGLTRERARRDPAQFKRAPTGSRSSSPSFAHS